MEKTDKFISQNILCRKSVYIENESNRNTFKGI